MALRESASFPHQPQTAEDAETGWLDKIKSGLGFEDDSLSLRQTIESALQSENKADTSFEPQERMMLLNILRFGALRVEDVMVPRADIIAIDEEESLAELLKVFEQAGHSRVPLYRNTLDDPVGMVHIKDFMKWITNLADPKRDFANAHEESATDTNTKPNPLDLTSVDLSQAISSTKIKRNILFVPGSMPVITLFLRMQTTRVHMALVIDEYGGTNGLVSIEDLVEEIVGDIEDEHDNADKPMICQDPVHGLIADARTPIEDLEKRLKQELDLPNNEEDEFETLGGLVFSLVGRVPVRGELIKHPKGIIEFEVMDADPRRIKMLKIHNHSASKKKPKKTSNS